MLNMSIILFRYKQFASKIYNAISMYYFLCKLITDLQNFNSLHIHWATIVQTHLTVARLKNGTTQWFRLANSASTFINLSWYERKSYAQKFSSVRFGKKNRRFGSGSAKSSWFGRFLLSISLKVDLSVDRYWHFQILDNNNQCLCRKSYHSIIQLLQV